MLRTPHIIRHVCAAAAVLALLLPVRTVFGCPCCTDDAQAPETTRSMVKAVPACCATTLSAGDRAADPEHRDTSVPRSCPQQCPSPCCLASPSTPAFIPLLTDFCRLAPAGLVFVQAAQQPAPPALDGLLRPPRY